MEIHTLGNLDYRLLTLSDDILSLEVSGGQGSILTVPNGL